MAQNNHNEKKHSHKGAMVAGMGLAALAAATAGAVFLYGTEAGKKRRKQIESWSLRMKADVIDAMENMKDWSEDSYHDVVANVEKKYKMMKNVDPAEVVLLVDDLKKHWKSIKKEVEKGMKTTKTRLGNTTTPKTVKKPAAKKAE